MNTPTPPITPTPTEDTESELSTQSHHIHIHTLKLSSPFRWLKLGWFDFIRCPAVSLFFGMCFSLMGMVLLWVFYRAPQYVLVLSAGFLLMGPFLCLGLYDASRALQTKEYKPNLAYALGAWEPSKGALALYAGVLLVLEMLWARAALVVFAVNFSSMPDMSDFGAFVLDPENIGFIISYLAVAAIFAGLIFSVSVVSIPMILDRRVDAVTAGLISLRACMNNADVMVLWGLLIVSLTLLSMLPAFVGLLFMGPILGHASWHAYKETVGYEDENTTTSTSTSTSS